MALTLKKLDKIGKSLQGIFAGDPEQLAEIEKTLAGVRAAMELGETFTKSDLNDILGGDVEVTQIGKQGGEESGEDMEHPLQAPMLDLFGKIFNEDGTIRKGVTAQSAQSLFEETYQKMANEFDGAIDATVEAATIELGKGNRVQFGKRVGKGKGPVTGADNDGDSDDDAGHEDMDKMLKGSVAGRVLLKKMADLSSEVSLLRSERDTAVFTKQAAEIGEPAGFAVDLAKLHAIDPKLADSIKKRLGAKNQLLQKAQVWGAELGEGGEGGDAGDSAMAQMTTMAKEKASKSNGTLTFAKAFSQVCTEQPELYAKHREETRAR